MATNKKLSAVITIGGAVAGSLRAAISSTNGQLQSVSKEVGALTRKQKLLGESIQVFARAGKDVDNLRAKYAATTTELTRMRREYDRLNTAQQRSDRLKSVGGKTAMAGAGMTAAGGAMLAPIVIGGKEAAHYQTERARITALGLGDEVSKDAEKFARGMKTLGTSKLENLTLVRDALSVFGDLHHAEMATPILAKMKFGNSAFYGGEHGADNERKFLDMLKVVELRGGTKSEADFSKQANMIQKVITATGGRVGPEEWRHLIATGGLAAKGTRDDAFYYQLEPLVQEMGGDRVGTGLSAAYSSLFQGHITKRAANNLQRMGLIADQSKVKHDKSGQVSFIDPGALKGAEVFRQSQYEWLKQVLLPALAAKGMTSKDQVLDAIGSIVSNKKGADILGAMYLQQQQIDKNEKMNRGAYDIEQINAEGMNTALGRQIIAQKKLEDLKLEVGQKVLPMYTTALQAAANVLDGLNGFMERHETLGKVMVVGIGAIGLGLAALGPVVAIAGAALTAYAAIQLRTAAASVAAARGIAAETVAMGEQAAVAGGGRAAGLLGLAGRAGLVGLAGAAGYGVGTLAYKGLLEGNAAGNGLGRGIARGMAFFGNKEAADSLRQESALPADHLPDVPSPAAPRAAGGGGPTVQDNSQNTYHFTLPPNTDVQQLADEIERRQRKAAGVRARSSLVDGMGVQ